jgi:hypothetical protein
MLSKGEERVAMTRELGGDRVVCGVKHIKSGNLERGVYTIVKGLYYLKSHYNSLREKIQTNNSACRELQEPTIERWVEAYLGATEGSMYETVYKLYKEVEEARSRVEELCTN